MRYGTEYERWRFAPGYDRDFGYRGRGWDAGFGGGYDRGYRSGYTGYPRGHQAYDRGFRGYDRGFRGGYGAGRTWDTDAGMTDRPGNDLWRIRETATPFGHPIPGPDIGYGMGFGMGRGRFIYK